MRAELLKQLEINNDFIKSFLSCLDESTQSKAKEIIINNATILLNSAEPLSTPKAETETNQTINDYFISDEILNDMLFKRGLPTTKALKTLCNEAIEERGTESFISFLNEVCDYLNKYKANNINSFFNKCLCNFRKTGRTPYNNYR